MIRAKAFGRSLFTEEDGIFIAFGELVCVAALQIDRKSGSRAISMPVQVSINCRWWHADYFPHSGEINIHAKSVEDFLNNQNPQAVGVA